jgi:hypothetical protein
MSETFKKFFKSGEYYSTNNNLYEGVDYKESDKAEVMRSILLECTYRLYNDEAQMNKLVDELSHYSIVNPVFNHFYEKWDLWHKNISKYSNRDTVVKINGYQHGKGKVYEYIKANAIRLVGIPIDKLQEIYKKEFMVGYDEFDKTFDFNEWRKNCSLWY